MDELKKNSTYNVWWVDNSDSVKCVFERKHRGFFIFIDEKGMKIICRPSSIRNIKEVI